ncbi:MAG: type II secretion system minor pseudopilin GspK [Gammaproteobacteria bacterium]|jgi:general secretion pathway protein K|nr:type II secretion system minor pseudopilin GspK [Gammaproteobacteria bacterium]
MKRQKGMALIIALLIVAMATLVATTLTFDFSLDQRRAQSLLATQQSRQLALGAEAWASEVLRDDLENSSTDHLGEEWAMQLPPLPADGFLVQGILEDMQGKFNLNNLVNSDGEADPYKMAQFQRLLVALDINPSLAGVVADWIDPDTQSSFPDGAEDDFYTGSDVPYRTPNTYITTITELQAVQGMNEESFRLLLPYVTVLPPGTQLNVNTAAPVVLLSLGEGIDIIQAESLAAEAAEEGFPDLQSFAAIVEPDIMPTLALSSDYFRLTVRVTIGTYSLTMYSLLLRDSSGQVRPLIRTFGSI